MRNEQLFSGTASGRLSRPDVVPPSNTLVAYDTRRTWEQIRKISGFRPFPFPPPEFAELICFPTVIDAERTLYSARKAVIGLTLSARRAGTTAARAPATIRTRAIAA